MRIFINFFLKTTAFFLAISVFFVIIALIIGFFSDFDKNFSTIEGSSNSNNKIALLKLNGPILNEPINNFDIGYLGNINIIFVSEVENKLKLLIHVIKLILMSRD